MNGPTGMHESKIKGARKRNRIKIECSNGIESLKKVQEKSENDP